MKSLIALALLLTPAAAAAQATGNCSNNATGTAIRQCSDSQVISTSGNSITIQSNGGLVPTFEEVIAGSPATVSITIQGCGPGGTCDTLDTNTTVANALRGPAMAKTYSTYKVTATWTGGTSPSVTINTLLTSARLSPGAQQTLPNGVPHTLCHQTTNIANTGNTSTNVIFQCVIPAGTIGNNSRLEMYTLWTAATNASACTVGMKFGNLGTASDPNLAFDSALSSTATTQMWVQLHERNSNAAQIYANQVFRNTTAVANQAPATQTYSTTGTLYVTYTAAQVTGTDTCSLSAADVVIWP